MGYASSGTCFASQADALADWCAKVEPGASATSCGSCDPVSGSCQISLLQTSSGTVQTVSVPVSTPACVVPTPADDALAYSGAAVALWVAVWAARQVYNMFRVSHADGV